MWSPYIFSRATRARAQYTSWLRPCTNILNIAECSYIELDIRHCLALLPLFFMPGYGPDIGVQYIPVDLHVLAQVTIHVCEVSVQEFHQFLSCRQCEWGRKWGSKLDSVMRVQMFCLVYHVLSKLSPVLCHKKSYD